MVNIQLIASTQVVEAMIQMFCIRFELDYLLLNLDWYKIMSRGLIGNRDINISIDPDIEKNSRLGIYDNVPDLAN